MRQVPLERDINIAVNGCSGFATSTQKGPFMAMLLSRSRGTYLIDQLCLLEQNQERSSRGRARQGAIVCEKHQQVYKAAHRQQVILREV